MQSVKKDVVLERKRKFHGQVTIHKMAQIVDQFPTFSNNLKYSF